MSLGGGGGMATNKIFLWSNFNKTLTGKKISNKFWSSDISNVGNTPECFIYIFASKPL
jgi:hypothetical protein